MEPELSTHDASQLRLVRDPVVCDREQDLPAGGEVAVAWNGLPPYGLNNVRALMAYLGVMPTVVGTRPDLSYDAIQAVSGLPIHWIHPGDTTATWARLPAAVPKVLIVSGWATPAFNALGREVRERGGRVIMMMDNRWRGDLRQRISPLIFKFKYGSWFSAAIVPGKSSRSFARYLGFPDAAIHEGLYSGNAQVLSPGAALHERPKRFLFVGRFDERKGVRELAEAWSAVQGRLPGWELHAVGEGGLQGVFERLPAVVLHAFRQQRQLVDLYQESRFLVLPSHEDHWGVVVHEAACSGCGLLLSENVGARLDLATPVNSFIFPARRPRLLANALLRAAGLWESRLRGVYQESLSLSARFGPKVFAEAVIRAIGGLQSSD